MAASLMTLSSAALAQEAPATDAAVDDGATEVIVVGAKKSLQNAQNIKKNAGTVVDSITATDIGAFPDKSVAEALQRVPGVTVTRSAYKDDVMHFSAEPSGVIIRGLPQVRSEFNGRDTFSATSGYGLSWSDISPEMMAGIDTYKNQTADMIEGGIAGSVNLRTRLPFDSKGRLLTGTITANYGDLDGRTTPEFSGVWSDRWSTDLGDFGFLANAAYSKVDTLSRGVILPRMVPFAAGTYTDEINYIPSGINMTETEYERERKGVSLAAQWASPDRSMKATLQYNKSTYDSTWNEDSVLSYWMWVDPATTTHSTVWTDGSLLAPPPGGDPFVFGDDGMFREGVITGSRGGWGFGSVDWSTGDYLPGSTDQYGQLPDGRPLYVPCLFPLNGNVACRAGAPVDMATRYNSEVRSVEDVSLNFIWTPTDKLSLNFDVQHVKAETNVYDVTVNLRTYANIGLDLTGEYPKIDLLAPTGYNTYGDDPFTNSANYSPQSIMDHRTDSKGTLDAFRIDAEYEFGGTWIDSLRTGVRIADRQQKHLWSAYNWASISSDWGVNPHDSYFVDSGPTYLPGGAVNFQGYEPGYYETRNVASDLLGGGLLADTNLIFMRRDIISNPEELAKRFSIRGQTDEGGIASSAWNPICERPDEMANSCYTPGEVLDIGEKTNSAYVMLKFGGPDASLGGFNIVGNLGMRYVENTVTSGGAINYANAFTSAELICKPLTPEEIAALGPNQYAISPGCLALGSVDDQAFSSGDSTTSTVKTTHKNWLPSFNVRVGLSDEWFLRFAASKAISKPDIGLLKNYMVLQRSFVPQTDIVVGNPNIVLDANGQPVSYTYGYTANMGNPRLKPISADQFDLAAEHYFASVGSLTFTLFYKKFHDYIQNGTFSVPITNNGVTRNVIATGPVNGDGASIKGFEAAYQRYFTFLPSPWDGLGIQANYTHLSNSGVKNAQVIIDNIPGVSTVARSSLSGMINPGRLEGLSDDAYNLILMYEKGRFGGRLAYNWRSKYLNSVNDCCVGFPVWNKSEGFLDASLRYAITDNIEFSLQGSNLLSTKVRMQQQVSGPTDLNPNAPVIFLPAGNFEYDKRVQAGVRVKF
jgi:TonB-dependent receptor